MSQQGFLMKRSGGKFTGSSYGNRKNKLDRRWFRIREGALYYYKQSSEMKESTHHAGKVALEAGDVFPTDASADFSAVNLYNLDGASTWPITMVSYLPSHAGFGSAAFRSVYTSSLPVVMPVVV